jgi:hypothetical protein
MATITVTQSIQAPVAEVFALACDIENSPGRIRDIVKVEMLTPGPMALGTKFKETRIVFKKEATETFEVTQFTPNVSYEFTANSCGAEYRTTFAFTPEGAGTRVDVAVRTRAVSFFAKLFTPLMFLMRGMLRKCVAKDLDDLRAAAEGQKKAA